MEKPTLRVKAYEEEGLGMSLVVLVVHGRLHKIGEQEPHFYLTGEIHVRKGRHWREYMCGCIHEEILKHFPELSDLAALHLSSMDGVPMHAVENGAYFLGLTRWEEYNQYLVASHFRLLPHEAEALHALVTRSPTPKETLRAWVNEQRPRWKKEAEECIEKHGLVVWEE